jgi:hypothetical protein
MSSSSAAAAPAVGAASAAAATTLSREEAMAAAGLPLDGARARAATSGASSSDKVVLKPESLLYFANSIPSTALGYQPRPPKEVSPEQLVRINSLGNRAHSGLDILGGTMAYSLSTMMMLAGQGTALTFVSMWGAGTYLFVMSQLRLVRGPEPEIWQGELQAAGLWFIASFRQFREFRTLKWVGYSSWTGLTLTSYLAFRALAAVLAEPDDAREKSFKW